MQFKNQIIFFITILTVFIGFSLPTVADTTVPSSGSGGSAGANTSNQIYTLQNPLKVDTIGGLVQTFVTVFSYVAVLFAVLMFIYLGFKYVTNAAAGNASEITKLHTQFMWLVVGVAIVIGARLMVQVIINTLSATGVDPTVINNANNALQGH